MERLDNTAIRAVRTILDGQPTSEAKIAFAWKISAGPAFAQAATLSWSDEGALSVQVKSDEWRREILRLRPIIMERMVSLLGPGVVRSLTVQHVPEEAPANQRRMFR